MMKKLSQFITTIFLVFAIQSVAIGQSVDLAETFKKSFNETVQKVQTTEDADEKRMLLNDSFSNMITVIERIESKANLSEKEIAQLKAYKNGIQEKKSELNGINDFNKVLDKNLNDFSDYSQQYFEQADKTITIGVTAAVLILILVVLLL